MVQNISVQSTNQLGKINKLTDTANGRSVYQIVDSNGIETAKLSIPQQDCDKFERAYNDIMLTAPKIQEYAQTHSSPEQMKHLKNVSMWSKIGGASLGFLIPSVTTFKLKSWLQWTLTILGTLAGYIGGSIVGHKLTTPEGMDKFTNAANQISKIDVQML